MARPERTIVENYLVEQVELHGGTSEKFVSPGKKNVPDQIITWPGNCEVFSGDTYAGVPIYFDRPDWTKPHREPLIEFAETKAPGKGANEGQKRDHARRRKMCVHVYVLNSRAKVDAYILSRRDRWTK